MALPFHTKAIAEYSSNNSYISTDTFNDDIYKYATQLNGIITSGTLTNLTGTSVTNCPAGRVLHLTGKSLYPNINPMNTFPSAGGLSGKTSPGVYLVSVYDPVTGFRGYIDPTSCKFAKFDQTLPNFFDLGTQGPGLPLLGGKGGKLTANSGTMTPLTLFITTPAATNTVTYNAGNASAGMFMPVGFGPAISVGSVSFYGYISDTTLTSTSVTLAEGMTLTGQGVASGTTIISGTGTSHTVSVSQTLGSSTSLVYFTAYVTANITTNNVGGSIVVNTTAAKTTSLIFLTPCANTAGLVAYPGATDGTFTIYVGAISALGPPGAAIPDGICFSWIIVN